MRENRVVGRGRGGREKSERNKAKRLLEVRVLVQGAPPLSHTQAHIHTPLTHRHTYTHLSHTGTHTHTSQGAPPHGPPDTSQDVTAEAEAEAKRQRQRGKGKEVKAMR